ncbi:MAG: hypothetical protein ACXIUZ_10420 [Lysobacteraceae bacterium]
MNMRYLRLPMVAAASLVLVACATTPRHEHEARIQGPQRQEVNADYVAAVEREARRRGVQVHWVSKPTRVRGN